MTKGRGPVGALAAVFFVAALASAVALVGRAGNNDGSLPRTRARPAQAPAGSLKVGVPELPAIYDPFDIRARTPAATQILSLVLPQLFEVTPSGEVTGRLADADSVEADGLTIRFELVEGAAWSDGTPITARDIAYTLDVIRSGDWPGPVAGYDAVESITGDGRDVTLRLARRFPGWRRLFSGEDYVLPRHRLEGTDLKAQWVTGPDVSGGPYALRGSTPGLDVVLTANTEWWGEGPLVRDLQVLTVPDATTLQYLFEQDELDVIWMPAFTERAREVRTIEGVDVEVAPPGGRLVSLYVQTDAVERDARAASLGLVDRDRFVEVLLSAEAEIATSWGLVEDEAGWADWALDAERADDVEHRDLAFAVPDEDPMATVLARAVQHRARPTRLAFDAVSLTNHLLDGEWLPEGKFDLTLVDEVQWPQPCWSCRFHSANVGESNWSRTDEYDDLVASADSGDADAAARLEQRLREDAVVLPLWRPGALVASRAVSGIEANAWAPGPFWHVEQWQTSTERPVQSTTSSAVPGG